jgi:enoyl-[acyl-carrier protein] reductase I
MLIAAVAAGSSGITTVAAPCVALTSQDSRADSRLASAARATAPRRGSSRTATVPVLRAVSVAAADVRARDRDSRADLVRLVVNAGAEEIPNPKSQVPSPKVSDFTGKHGLVVGVANKRSIAWAIAQATAKRGARLALTYQGRFEENVQELSEGLPEPPLIVPCDVTSDSDIDAVFKKLDQEFGGLDFLVHGAAFARKEELSEPFVNTSREGFRLAMDISAYSLIALARGAAPLMEKRGSGSIVTLSYLGSERVFPNYNVMGVAKAALEANVRYLAADLGPKNIRVNAVSAGPIKTISAMGIGGFSSILNVYRERAPLRRNVDTSEVGDAAAFLLSDAARGITGEVLMVDAGFHITGM